MPGSSLETLRHMTAASSSPPGPRLQKVLLSISRQAESDLALLPFGNPQSRIHALRVRMKKLRAILRLMQPALPATTIQAIRRHLRALKQAFAMNRDQHVLHALLDGLDAADLTGGRRSLDLGNSGRAGGPPAPAELRKLKATARRLTRLLQTMTLRPLAWDDVATAYASRYDKARRWFRRCEHKPSAARMHRWRAPVKDHYFQSLLMLRDRRHLNATRRLGSRLGQIHDLAMLYEHCHQDTSDGLAHAIRRQMKNLRARIFRKARHLFKRQPGKLSRQVRATLLPSSHQRTKSDL